MEEEFEVGRKVMFLKTGLSHAQVMRGDVETIVTMYDGLFETTGRDKNGDELYWTFFKKDNGVGFKFLEEENIPGFLTPADVGFEFHTENKKIDTHYNFNYTLTEQDKASGQIKIDPYFVGNVWKTGSRDDTGILFHSLKTIARFGDKNDKKREIKALYLQAKRLAEINGVNLDE